MEEPEKIENGENKQNIKVRKEYILLSIIVVAIVILDQILKVFVLGKGELQIIPNVLKFSITENTSAAYGIGSNSTIMYVLTNIIILGIIFKFVTTQNAYVDKKMKIFLSFIFAGGISNVIDRISRGYVVEFINFKDLVNLPVLNIADVFTIIGWVAVAAIFAAFTVNEWRKNKK